MSITSKRSIFSVLGGVIVGLLVYTFLRPTCWGPIVGVFLAAYLAKVSSAKEGALIGALVLAPMGIYSSLQTLLQTTANPDRSILVIPFAIILVVVLASGLGALYGSVIGKLFQLTKDKGILF